MNYFKHNRTKPFTKKELKTLGWKFQSFKGNGVHAQFYKGSDLLCVKGESSEYLLIKAINKDCYRICNDQTGEFDINNIPILVGDTCLLIAENILGKVQKSGNDIYFINDLHTLYIPAGNLLKVVSPNPIFK